MGKFRRKAWLKSVETAAPVTDHDQLLVAPIAIDVSLDLIPIGNFETGVLSIQVQIGFILKCHTSILSA